MDGRAVAHAVLVLKRPFQHQRDDLHVAVTVGAEALARLHAILVDDAKIPETHVARIEVVSEREGVTAVEPVELRAPALAGLAYRDHRPSLVTAPGPFPSWDPRGEDARARATNHPASRMPSPPQTSASG